MKYSIGKTSGVFIGDETVVKIFNIRNSGFYQRVTVVYGKLPRGRLLTIS